MIFQVDAPLTSLCFKFSCLQSGNNTFLPDVVFVKIINSFAKCFEFLGWKMKHNCKVLLLFISKQYFLCLKTRLDIEIFLDLCGVLLLGQETEKPKDGCELFMCIFSLIFFPIPCQSARFLWKGKMDIPRSILSLLGQ